MRLPFCTALTAGIVLAGILTATNLSSPGAEALVPTARANKATADCGSSTTCYTPQGIESAYGIAPLFDHGVDGAGETVVLPELAEPQFPLPTSDIRADLAQFDKLFDLPAAHLRSVTTLAPSASPWLANGEEVLDTETVHAVAPAATIVELMVSATSLDNATSAVAALVAARPRSRPRGHRARPTGWWADFTAVRGRSLWPQPTLVRRWRCLR